MYKNWYALYAFIGPGSPSQQLVSVIKREQVTSFITNYMSEKAGEYITWRIERLNPDGTREFLNSTESENLINKDFKHTFVWS